MPKSASCKLPLPWQDGHQHFQCIQHIPQIMIPFPLIIDRLFLLCSLSGSLSLFLMWCKGAAKGVVQPRLPPQQVEDGQGWQRQGLQARIGEHLGVCHQHQQGLAGVTKITKAGYYERFIWRLFIYRSLYHHFNIIKNDYHLVNINNQEHSGLQGGRCCWGHWPGHWRDWQACDWMRD